ncbi:MAG TPA: DUF423 domain-containing protein [Bacilli bacterium]|nr:DUF423 domain-containing protein [Bacilli bacterium]
MRTFLMLGSINLFLAVALGAFGAHGLKDIVSERMLANWQTGVHYHMIHALGMLAIAAFGDRLRAKKQARIAGWLFLIGIFFFAGSLYAMAPTGILILGAITPIGGVCFLVGWFLLFYAALKEPKASA